MRLCAGLLLAASGAGYGQVAPGTPGWFEFDVPGLAAPEGAEVDLSHLNPQPIDQTGSVSVVAGHFADASGQRLRLFGTNITGDSCFPDEEVSPRLARRLRQYGFNCLRLHFMDFSWGGRNRDSLWADAGQGTLSAASLAKLDRLIAECAGHGIYLNLNLHVGREYPGNPEVDGSQTFRFSKNLDRWYEPFIVQMEQFCRDLLNHVNPHTGRRYAEEPAIACLEISNENTMIQDALRSLRQLPEPFLPALEGLWTEWLRARYGSTAALRQAWDADVVPLGEERLVAPDAWLVQNAGGAASTLERSGTRLTWTATAAGSASWNLQLQYKGLTLEPGRYTLRLRARSSQANRLGVCAMLDAEPWGQVGLGETLELTPEWRWFTIAGPVVAPSAPGPLRLNVSLLNQTGQAELDEVSLKSGGGAGLGPEESLETGVGLPPVTAVDSLRRDWTRFLVDTELRTTRRILRLLKEELGCRMPVADTQVSYGGVAGVLREATLCDYTDIHAYWEHPSYTRERGSGTVTGFRIPNTTQVAAVDGGALARIAVYRVAGRPFSVSEYNTPAPNDHGAELFPLFTAVAALQDWDAFYSYTYRDFGKDYENTFIRKYFHLIGRANVLVHAPACSLAFRQGLIADSAEGVECLLPAGSMAELAWRHRGMPELWQHLGAAVASTWLRKATVALAAAGETPVIRGDTGLPEGVRVSATGQLRWQPADPGGAWFSLNAPAVRFLIGHLGGRSFDVGDVTLRVLERPWPHDVPAYACVSLAALDGRPLAASSRMLLAASARTENSNMPWNEDRTSLRGDAWGERPTLSEAVPLDVRLPGADIRAWRLDPAGRREAELLIERNTLQLRSEHGTLWVLLTRD
jgi:hypothetical protein